MKRSTGLKHTLTKLYRGQSLLRIRTNEGFSAMRLSGRTLDLGGGHAPDYFQYFKQDADVSIEMINGSSSAIDFEKDRLPFADGSFTTIILANVLEHIYNYPGLLGEVRRILAPGGTLIGFVPFWIGYHADPHDYFRYTHEALTRMLGDARFINVEITPLPGGPLLANFNTIVLSLLRWLRPIAYLWYALLDAIYVRLKPKSSHRNPLGYIFSAAV